VNLSLGKGAESFSAVRSDGYLVKFELSCLEGGLDGSGRARVLRRGAGEGD
jgi:hypothetical protein